MQATRIHLSVERDLRRSERRWDYGPLGVELKRNVKQAWWDDMVARHDETATPPGAPSSYGMVGLDSSLLMNPRVWEASGHVGGFSDPMVDDRETRERYRADQLAVFALELVGGDGKRERYDEILFASPGEVGKIRAKRALRAASKAHRFAAEDAREARRPALWPCPERCKTRLCAPRCSRPARRHPAR